MIFYISCLLDIKSSNVQGKKLDRIIIPIFISIVSSLSEQLPWVGESDT